MPKRGQEKQYKLKMPTKAMLYTSSELQKEREGESESQEQGGREYHLSCLQLLPVYPHLHFLKQIV